MARWTPEAIGDAQDIWDYIASDNETAADRTVDKIEAAAERLDTYPRMGRVLRKPKARQFVVPGTPYKLIYRVLTGGVEILRVLHGARRWPPKG